jgi:hypothetical protein
MTDSTFVSNVLYVPHVPFVPKEAEKNLQSYGHVDMFLGIVTICRSDYSKLPQMIVNALSGGSEVWKV